MELTGLVLRACLLLYLTHSPLLGSPLRNVLQVEGIQAPAYHVRQPRNGGICPRSMSSAHCFYSQMYVFMRMHSNNGLRDPVELRNIGKRQYNSARQRDVVADLHNVNKRAYDVNYGENPVIPYDSFEYMPIDASVVSVEDGNEPMLDEMSTFNGARDVNWLDDSYQFRIPDYLDVDELNWPMKDTLNGHVDKRRGQVIGSNTGNIDRNLQVASPQKRQIICPAGMARRDCYDDAFAFYLRLLRTVS